MAGWEEINKRALEIRQKYAQFEIKEYSKEWSAPQIAQGLTTDIGTLNKLIMAKEGFRKVDNIDEQLAHELVDCLWSIIVLADKYGINLEESFWQEMKTIENRLDHQ